MATRTETIEAIVLKRTKLGESDVIVTLLAQDGSQYRAVAKGARKPTSTFASRLETFAISTVLLAKGKNLDIVKEARLREGFATLRCDYMLTSAASPIVELLARSTFQEQPTPRLFSMTERSFHAIEQTEEDPLVITAACLLKALGILGFRPRFDHCIECGSSIDLSSGLTVPFSYFDGGSVCIECAQHHETTLLDRTMLQWANILLYSTFDEIVTFKVDQHTISSLITFISEWTHVHLGFDLRSLKFLFKNIIT